MSAPNNTEETILRVGGATPAEQLGGAIAAIVYERGNPPILRAIGASAVSQAVKGLIIASQFTASRGINLTFRPGFDTLDIDGKEITAILFRVIVS